jgi:apolipoprotein N-acyltransferase
MIKQMRSNRNSLLFTSSVVIASAILYFCATGLNGYGPLLFLAPILILILANRSAAKVAFLCSFLAYAIGGLNMVSYLKLLVPIPLIVLFVLFPSLLFALAVISARAATLHGQPWLAVFVFPAVWTAYEFLLSLVSPNGTAGSIAYAQTSLAPLIQIASLTGIWGITFMTTLVPATVAVLWHRWKSKGEMLRISAAPAALTLFVVLFGFSRLLQPGLKRSVSVGLAACDTSIDHFRATELGEALPVAEAYSRRAAELGAKGAQIIVLPEKFLGVTRKYDSVVFSLFRRTARNTSAIVIAGFDDIESPSNVNEAISFFPAETTLRYRKKYFVPGIEAGYLPGSEPLVFQCDSVNMGVEICKDMDFPSWSREYGSRDVRILFVPAWDFTVDGRMHSRMAVMRGLENGFSVARCAQQGLLTASDSRGRVVAETASGPEAALECSVPLGTGKTFYSVTGDWFGWLNVIFVFVFVDRLLWHKIKTAAI